MRAFFIVWVLALSSMGITNTTADEGNISASPPPANHAPSAASTTYYKNKLYTFLDAGNLTSGNLDKNTEISIAHTQLELSKAYMQQGDRKLALILGILARKNMQQALGNPHDPAMIPIYSILVQLYTSKVDSDAPGTDQSDAAKAKEYREAIDSIHAQ